MPMSSAPGRDRTIGGVAIVAVLALVMAVVWASGRSTASPRVVEGLAMPNASGTAISLHAEEGDGGEGYIIAGARWSGTDGLWHDGATSPTCVGTDTSRAVAVQIGVIDVRDDEAGDSTQAVWLRCLE
ncbi:MAG: hypothetical protein WD011_08965 [Nitriliruptoraceae bacterium]